MDSTRYMELTLWLGTGLMLTLAGLLVAFLSLFWLTQWGKDCMVFLTSIGLVLVACGLMNTFIGFLRLPYPKEVRI